MKPFISLAAFLLAFVSLSHGGDAPPQSLAETFARAHFKLDQINRIVIEGDESSFTSGVAISLTRKPLFPKFFRFFEGTTPYKHWVASGNQRLHLFTADSDVRPATTLYVNETDYVSTDMDQQTYRCKGLHAFIERFLAPIATVTNEQ